MASEIRVTTQITINNGYFTLPLTGSVKVLDQTNIGGGVPGQITLTVTPEVIDLTEITVPGYVFLKNIDEDDSVIFGSDDSGGSGGTGTFCPFLKLKPGEEALFRLCPDITFMACAETSTAKAIVQVFED